MIKNKEEFEKCIDELEVLIKETDKEINKAYKASESMDEPTKSCFIKVLNLRKIQLDTNKETLIHFKMLTRD